MKKILFLLLTVFFSGTLLSAQETNDTKKEEKKVIIIKTMDDDGKMTTKVLEGDDLDDESVWIEELGDSIKVTVDIDDMDGKKVIRKKIMCNGERNTEKEFYFSGEQDRCRHPKPECKMEKPGFNWQERFSGPAENKARLGVYIEDFNGAVKVTDVIENSAAYSVGIFAGDVITEINDKKITNTEELIREIGTHNPGDFIEVELKRNGKKKEFDVRLHGNNKMNFENQSKNFPKKEFEKKIMKFNEIDED